MALHCGYVAGSDEEALEAEGPAKRAREVRGVG